MSVTDVEDLLRRQNASRYKVVDHYFEGSGIIKVLRGTPPGSPNQVTVLSPAQQLASSTGIVIIGIKNLHVGGVGLDSIFWDVLIGANAHPVYHNFQGGNPGEPWRELFITILPGSAYSIRAVNWSGTTGYPIGTDAQVFCELTGYKFTSEA